MPHALPTSAVLQHAAFGQSGSPAKTGCWLKGNPKSALGNMGTRSLAKSRSFVLLGRCLDNCDRPAAAMVPLEVYGKGKMRTPPMERMTPRNGSFEGLRFRFIPNTRKLIPGKPSCALQNTPKQYK